MIRRLVLALLLLPIFVLIPPAHAQASGQVTLSFNHVALSVKDLGRSADFYGRLLGLSEITRASRTDAVRWFSLGGGQELHLISHKYFQGNAVQTNKAVHLALTTNRFDDLLKRLDAGNIAYGNWEGAPGVVNKRSDGIRQVFLQDPDGYWLEVNDVEQEGKP